MGEHRRTSLAARALLVLGLFLLAPRAASEQLPLQVFTTAEGLPHNRVKRIVEDRHGFIWFCTTEGLARFDGRAFVTYRVAEGLPVPSVNDLLPDGDDGTWVATNGGGVALFAPEASLSAGGRRFTVVPVGDTAATARVNVLLRDATGRLWAGTDGGLFRLELDGSRRGGSFRRVALGIASRLDADVPVWALQEDAGGTLWVGTRHGLVLLSPDGSTRHVPIEPRGTDNVFALRCDRQGRLWVGHDGAGVLVFAPGGGALEPVRRYTPAQLGDGSVRSIHETRDGEIWLGTASGLALVDGPRVHGYGRAQGLSGAIVSALATDRDGNLWIGTATEGVLRLARRGFVRYREEDGLGTIVGGILERRDGALWVTSSGWRISELRDGVFRSVRPRFRREPRPSNWHSWQSVLSDREGDVWVATGEGLHRFGSVARLEDLAAREAKAVYTTADGLGGDDVSVLFEDRNGDLWIGSRGGDAPLTRWSRATGRFQRYGPGDGLPATGSVRCFSEDGGGNLWIGFRDAGLVRRNGDGFRTMPSTDGFPTGTAGTVGALHLDATGRLWVSTSGDGLLRVDEPAAGRPRAVRVGRDKGIDGYLSGLTSDRQGRIYVGTSHDLWRYDPHTGHTRRYTAADGLASSDVLAAHRDRDGVLWLGSQAGLARFVPGPDEAPRPPEVRIGAVRVAGLARPVEDLGSAVVALGELDRRHNQIGIDFFSIGLPAGEVLRFQYRLEGLDQEWSRAAEARTADYARLPAGRYRFQVRALDTDGLRSPEPATVSFEIPPPFWDRWWFLLGAALLVGLAGYGVDHVRSSRQLALERTRTRLATDLHDDVGTSLSRIAVLAEVAHRQADRRGERLAEIASLARELVDDLADVVWGTDPRCDDLASLVRRIRRFALDVLEPRGISWRCAAPPDDVAVTLSPAARRQLLLVLKEAIHNAARHSSATSVSLTLSVSGRWLEAELTDDGTGVADPGAGDVRRRSAGRGVASMKERATRIGGDLELGPGAGRGTRLWLRIPR